MSLRGLPAVERLLQSEAAAEMISVYGRALTLEAIRLQLESARAVIKNGAAAPSEQALLVGSRAMIEDWLAPSLRPVVNATGVVLHTNLGRAPLSASARQALLAIAQGYSTLEYELSSGSRGKRDVHTESLLCRLTGAEAALVVNNNAAAVLLALTALARRKEVLISRSQLIEIGGGFRIPDVLKQSGAKLVEVGTTNRTHLADFAGAISARTRLILRAHHSNFRIVGYTSEPTLEELVDLARRHDLHLLDDLGSGALIDTEQFGLGHEFTVQQSLAAGVSLVAFSGDKLLGGPQAGILLGQKPVVDRLRKHPLARALRADKLCLAALSATLLHYLKSEAERTVPVWRMIATSHEELRRRALAWASALNVGEVIPAQSTVGGGSLPEETQPTWVLALDIPHAQTAAARLRQADPPVVARIEAGRLIFDPRTVLPEQDEEFVRVLASIIPDHRGPKEG